MPSPPQKVNYSISDGQVFLSWEPPVDMAGGLVYYVVKLDGHNLSCAVDVSADLECLVSKVSHVLVQKKKKGNSITVLISFALSKAANWCSVILYSWKV